MKKVIHIVMANASCCNVLLGPAVLKLSGMPFVLYYAGLAMEIALMADETRVATLKEILDQNPDDAFARYALGLEYSGGGETDEALRHFNLLLESHPDYTNGYFMAAQTLARAERKDEARDMLLNGIECARRTRNQHALAEMEGMLDELERGY